MSITSIVGENFRKNIYTVIKHKSYDVKHERPNMDDKSPHRHAYVLEFSHCPVYPVESNAQDHTSDDLKQKDTTVDNLINSL